MVDFSDLIQNDGEAVLDFRKSPGDANVLNDTKRIAHLLTAHHFTAAAFLSTYTVELKT